MNTQFILGLCYIAAIIAGFAALFYTNRRRAATPVTTDQHRGISLIIVDHYARTVFTNISGKGSAHLILSELQLKGLPRHYTIMQLDTPYTGILPDTTALIERRENLFIIETTGDL